MKISLEELKRAVGFIEAHTNEISVNIEIQHNEVLLKSFDKSGKSVIIKLFSDSSMHPTITRTEILK